MTLLSKAAWLSGAALSWLGLAGKMRLLLLGLALAVVPAGLTWIKLKISHAEEIGKIRGDAAAACEIRVSEITAKINEAADQRISDAQEAEDAANVIETDSDVASACANDPLCRDREVKKQ
ncbi:MAG: hypothetical protein RIC14_05735 [Filomicrobium sp.]